MQNRIIGWLSIRHKIVSIYVVCNFNIYLTIITLIRFRVDRWLSEFKSTIVLGLWRLEVEVVKNQPIPFCYILKLLV